MLNVRELEAFRAFIETGSVTQAAERLGRTQPQVGRLLVALEETVGFALFNRVGKRLQATPEGWRFYEEADRVMRELQGLTRTAAHIRTGASEHLKILVAPHFTSALVSRALVEVRKRMPGLTAEVDSRIRLDIETWITRTEFDLGICVLPIDNPTIAVERLLQTRAVIVMPATHPLADKPGIDIDDIVGVDIVATHSRSLLRQNLERLFREQGGKPKIAFEATNGAIACDLAGQGLGVALADPFVALSTGTPGMCIRHFKPDVTLEYGFLSPIGKTRSAAAQALADAIRSTAAECLQAMQAEVGHYTLF